MSMTEERVRELLESALCEDDEGLYSCGWYLAWSKGNDDASLDGSFTADELEAIAYWMRRK